MCVYKLLFLIFVKYISITLKMYIIIVYNCILMIITREKPSNNLIA